MNDPEQIARAKARAEAEQAATEYTAEYGRMYRDHLRPAPQHAPPANRHERRKAMALARRLAGK